MRSLSSKSIVFALALSLTLTASSSFAATRQNGDREHSRTAIERIVRLVQRLFGGAPNDDIFIPHP